MEPLDAPNIKPQPFKSPDPDNGGEVHREVNPDATPDSLYDPYTFKKDVGKTIL